MTLVTAFVLGVAVLLGGIAATFFIIRQRKFDREIGRRQTVYVMRGGKWEPREYTTARLAKMEKESFTLPVHRLDVRDQPLVESLRHHPDRVVVGGIAVRYERPEAFSRPRTES